AEALAALLGEPGPRVIALGGGSLLDTARRREALARARVVTLTASVETILARTAGTGRPLLDAAPDRAARGRERPAARPPAGAEAYAEAHARVATDGLPVDEVASAVLEAWARPAIAVALGARSYPVRFANGEPGVAAAMVAALRPSQVFVMTDENVARHWGSA